MVSLVVVCTETVDERVYQLFCRSVMLTESEAGMLVPAMVSAIPPEVGKQVTVTAAVSEVQVEAELRVIVVGRERMILSPE